MPKTVSQPVSSPASFVMPLVNVGQVVLWSYGPTDGEKSPAIVLKVGQRTLNLAVHVDGVKDHVHKTGVRHVEDPFVNQTPQHDAGVWRFTERDRLIDEWLRKNTAGYVEEE